MQIPDDRYYTDEHEWILDRGNGVVRVGVSDYAQDQLGDVVFVELPDVGKSVSKEDLLAEIESTKSVGEVYAPFSGTVTAVNQAVSDAPELINQSPYEQGWLLELDLGGDFDPSALLDAAAYRDLTE